MFHGARQFKGEMASAQKLIFLDVRFYHNMMEAMCSMSCDLDLQLQNFEANVLS